MTLHWGKDFLLQLLPEDLQQRFPEALSYPAYDGKKPIPHVNGLTGEVLGTVASPSFGRVSKRKLRQLLAPSQLVNIEVHL